MNNKSAMIWRIGVILLGSLLLLPAYYWAHLAPKPNGNNFIIPLGAALGGAALNLAVVVALFIIAGGIGRAVLAALDLTVFSRAERIALTTLTGLGIVGSGALLLGMIGLFNPLALWLPLLIAAGALARLKRIGLEDWRVLFAGLDMPNGWSRYLALLTGILLALALLQALAPPTAWDSLTYHLVAPARYLAEGRIAAQPDNHFLGFPQLAELVYGVAMSPARFGEAGALAHFGFGALGLLAVAGLTRRYAGSEAGWLAVMLLLSAFSLWLLLGRAYVDLAVLAYSAAALVVLARWRESGGRAWLIVLGMLAGFAFSVKYTAGGLALALVVALIVTQPRRAPRAVAIFATVALIMFWFWAVKGALLYQNPIYPFIFNGLNWDADRAATFSTFGTGLLHTGDAWQLPLLPIMATIFGVERGAGYAFTTGAWLLTAPLLLVPGWSFLSAAQRSLARTCLLIALPLLLFWMALAATTGIGAQTRLMAMLFPTAAVLGALGFHALWQFPEKPVQISFIVRALLAGSLAFGAVEAGRELVRGGALSVLLGFESRDAYLDANLGAHTNALRALGDLPSRSTVLLMWEPRSYYCPPQVACQPDILFDHWARPLRIGMSPDEVFALWRDGGVDYLLVWSAGLEAELSNPDSRFAAENAQFADALAANMAQTWTDGVRYTLYGWRE